MIQLEIKENDIFYSSWGYEQTNIDFYKVKKVTKEMVSLVAIESRIVEEESNYHTDAVVPYPANEGKNVFRRKVKHACDRPYVSINSFACAFPYKGKPLGQTNPMYGH
tara:strand:+ start:1878 stop:2201 length:324 start_codon:yes stop_codon:yes gene_type:complete